MNGRNEIVSAGGVPGNRHATSVPPPFPAGPTRSRHPSATGRAGLHAGGTRCAAWPTSSRRSGTPPRPATSPGTRPGPGTDRGTRRSRGSRRPRSRLSRRAPTGPPDGRSSAGRSGWACSGRRLASATRGTPRAAAAPSRDCVRRLARLEAARHDAARRRSRSAVGRAGSSRRRTTPSAERAAPSARSSAGRGAATAAAPWNASQR